MPKPRRKRIPIALQIAMGAAAFVAIFHTVRTRTLHDFLTDGMSWIVIVGVLGLIGALLFYGLGRHQSRAEALLRAILFFFLALTVASYVSYSLEVSLEDLARWTSKLTVTLSWRSLGLTILAGITVLALGSGLFYFRLRWRSLYGLSEALVGLVIAMQQIMDTPPEAPHPSTDFILALVTASLYLVVRGLDNVHQGLTKDPLDPVAIAFVKQLHARLPARAWCMLSVILPELPAEENGANDSTPPQ